MAFAEWYLIIYAILAIWVYIDAKKRKDNEIIWTIATVILGFIVLPFYLTKRNLKVGEVREGGTSWNILKYFALFWTITMVIAGISALGAVSAGAPQHGSEYEQAGYAIGSVIGLGMIFGIWIIVLIATLVLGLFLKKNSIIERGPTGALAQESKRNETNMPDATV